MENIDQGLENQPAALKLRLRISGLRNKKNLTRFYVGPIKIGKKRCDSLFKDVDRLSASVNVLYKASVSQRNYKKNLVCALEFRGSPAGHSLPSAHSHLMYRNA